MYRRIRKPNYTYEETMALLEQLEIHRHILFGRATNHQRSEMWSIVADAVNAVPNSAGRTVEVRTPCVHVELKHRWKDMSHRARIFSQVKANKEQTTIVPSVYFDIIMRILGEDKPEGLEYGIPTANQTSASRFSEDSQIYTKTDVDIKPDINVINRYINGEGMTGNLSLIPTSASLTTIQPVDSFPSSANHNSDIVQNGAFQISPAFSIQFGELGDNFSAPSQRNYSSQPLPCSSAAEFNHSHFKSISSEQHSSRSTISGKSCTKMPQTQASVMRPMRFDPITQEVTEIDDLNLHSDTSDDESSCSKLTLSVADGLENERLNGRETSDNSMTATDLHDQPPRKKRKLDTADVPMQSLSMEDLKKLYLIKKIKMISQRTFCFKLLEEKLKCEINLIQKQASVKSQPSCSISSSHSGPTKLSEKHKGTEEVSKNNNDNEQEEENVFNVESKSRPIGDHNCEQMKHLGDVGKHNSENNVCITNNSCTNECDENRNSCNDRDSQKTDFKLTV